MPATLTLLHTSPVHIATFDRLLAEVAPDVPVRHVVEESLLRQARDRGHVTVELAGRIAETVQDALEQDAKVVLCTCSTIGGAAEAAGQTLRQVVLRVDRPMAERAVTLGTRIVVMAALASTIVPTRELVLDVARQSNKDIELVEVLCEDAWAIFERGDIAGYHQAIARRLRDVASVGDVIVLAQASMAEATRLCANLPVPVLSSPRLGLEAAVKVFYES
jgi:hypothetical protein